MAYLTYFVVMACVILTVSSQAALEDVIELDEASWNARSPSAFYAVMFYETDCPFSAKFAPNWKEFAAEAPAELTVAAMECSDNKALCNQVRRPFLSASSSSTSPHFHSSPHLLDPPSFLF